MQFHRRTQVLTGLIAAMSLLHVACADPFGQINPKKSDGTPIQDDGLKFANAAYLEFDEEFGFGSDRLPRGPNGEVIDPATLTNGGCEWLDPDRAPRTLDACLKANEVRRAQGLPIFVLSLREIKAAWKHARHMYQGNYFSHNDPDGKTPFDRMKDEGVKYTTAGENIAKGTQTAGDTMTNWMNSPDHRANLLNSAFRYHGIAYYKLHWVHDLSD
jgi:hypothetical protein